MGNMHSVSKWLFKNIAVYSFFRTLLFPIRKRIRIASFNVKWRKKNRHNFTTVNNMFPLDKVNVGNGTYGELNVHAFGDENEGLSIGNYCSIAENVHFLLGGNHPMDTLSTYPFREYILKTASEKLLVHQTGSKGTITVSDDVWIGHGTIVLSGVHIGQGAVIGAGSIVTKDIPPYAIFAGGNVRRFRFEQDVIDKMVHIHYAGFGEKELEKLKGIIDQPVTEKNVDEIIELLRNP